METKSFEVLHRSLSGNAVKTASALREALASMSSSARDRIHVVRRRNVCGDRRLCDPSKQ